MKLYDQHLHSYHSFDSKADPAENVRSAIEKGLAGLTFTEHYDTHPDEAPTCVYDAARYGETIARLRETFGPSIRIGQGVEIDYQADNMPALIDFVERNPFDLVILSVHWSDGIPIHVPQAWDGRDASEVTRRYLQSVVAAVRHVERIHKGRRIFDVLGHMDFCKRYSFRLGHGVHVHKHMDVVDEILKACLAADLVPEMNTSTFRRGLADPMPAEDTIRRYVELGGVMMSLGSDSHRSEEIATGFDRAVRIFRSAGIKQLAVHERRARRGESIEFD